MRPIILDLFAVPDGWSHALTILGARDIGLEPRTDLHAPFPALRTGPAAAVTSTASGSPSVLRFLPTSFLPASVP